MVVLCYWMMVYVGRWPLCALCQVIIAQEFIMTWAHSPGIGYLFVLLCFLLQEKKKREKKQIQCHLYEELMYWLAGLSLLIYLQSYLPSLQGLPTEE